MNNWHNGHNSYWIPFADFLTGVLSIFLVVAFLLLVSFNIKQNDKQADIKSPGAMMITVVWAEDVDVDLWVKSPDDNAVGFKRKQGKDIDLLRDDRGRGYEKVGDRHYENAYARVLPPGEYIVNLHMFSNRINVYPIGCDVEVSLMENNITSTILKTKIELIHSDQELTVVRFQIDDKGHVVESSINHDQIGIKL